MHPPAPPRKLSYIFLPRCGYALVQYGGCRLVFCRYATGRDYSWTIQRSVYSLEPTSTACRRIEVQGLAKLASHAGSS